MLNIWLENYQNIANTVKSIWEFRWETGFCMPIPNSSNSEDWNAITTIIKNYHHDYDIYSDNDDDDNDYYFKINN